MTGWNVFPAATPEHAAAIAAVDALAEALEPLTWKDPRGDHSLLDVLGRNIEQMRTVLDGHNTGAVYEQERHPAAMLIRPDGSTEMRRRPSSYVRAAPR